GAPPRWPARSPAEAEVVRGETTEIVPISALQVGDIVLVRPGGRIPADGVVITGSAEVDESMVTGESRPVLRAEGEEVVAGTVATDNAIPLEVGAIGG